MASTETCAAKSHEIIPLSRTGSSNKNRRLQHAAGKQTSASDFDLPGARPSTPDGRHPSVFGTVRLMNRREFLRAASAASIFAGPYQRLASAFAKKVKITD